MSVLQPARKQEEDEQSILGKVFDVLGRPSKGVAGFVRGLQEEEDPLQRAYQNLTGERKDDFESVLKREGVEEGWGRTLGGLTGDIALDPLNLAGGPILKGAGALLKGGKSALGGLPLIEKFVPYAGLEKTLGASGQSYKNLRRLHESRLNSASAEANDAITSLLGKYKDEAGDLLSPEARQKIAFALDKGEELTGAEGEVQKGFKKLLDEQWEKEVAAGLQDPAKKKGNYITYLLNEANDKNTRARALSGKMKFKDRAIPTLEKAAEMGAETDAAKIAAARLGSGKRVIANNEFFQQIAQDFGKVDPADGFRKVSFAADDALGGQLQDIYVPEGVADDIEKIVNFEAKGGDELLKGFQKYLGVWKAYATKINPAFHIRNAIGNAFNSWLGGMHPATIGPLTIKAMMGEVPAVGKYSADEVGRALKEYGVVGSGHTGFREMNALLDPSTQTKLLDNFVVKTGEYLGNSVEEGSRKALFYDQLRKGKTLEEAALHVRKYLFDYSELTDVEKGLRNWAFPFYTWTRKNMPLQIEAILTQPGKVSTVGNVKEEFEKATADLSTEGKPTYMREGDWLQVPFSNKEGAKTFIRPSLPLSDLNRLEEPLKEILNMIGPQKIPLELALNKKAFTGKPIYDEQDPNKAMRGSDTLGVVMKLLGEKQANKLGIFEEDGGVKTTHPTLDHILSNIPLTNYAGRWFSNPNEIEAGMVEDTISPQVLAMLGLTTKNIGPKQEKYLRRSKKRVERTKRTNAKNLDKLRE